MAAEGISVVLRQVGGRLKRVLAPGIRRVRTNELRGQHRIVIGGFPLASERDSVALAVVILRAELSAERRIGDRQRIGPPVCTGRRWSPAVRPAGRQLGRVGAGRERGAADLLAALTLERDDARVAGLEVRDLDAVGPAANA